MQDEQDILSGGLVSLGGQPPPRVSAPRRRKLSPAEIADSLREAGWDEQHIPTMTAIAQAESSGDPQAHNPKYPDDSYGLLQVNRLAHPQFSPEQLRDPVGNARAGLDVFKRQGLKAWSTYTTGRYKKHLGKDTDDDILSGGLVPAPRSPQSPVAPVSPDVAELAAVGRAAAPEPEVTPIAAPTATSAGAATQGAEAATTSRVGLTTNDAAWHLGMSPFEAQTTARRARVRRVLAEAVAEDQRKRAEGQEIRPPSIRYQNEMRAKAGLEPISVDPNRKRTIDIAGVKIQAPESAEAVSPYYKPESGTLPTLTASGQPLEQRGTGIYLPEPNIAQRIQERARAGSLTDAVAVERRRKLVEEETRRREEELNSGVISREQRNTPGYFTRQNVEAAVDTRMREEGDPGIAKARDERVAGMTGVGGWAEYLAQLPKSAVIGFADSAAIGFKSIAVLAKKLDTININPRMDWNAYEGKETTDLATYKLGEAISQYARDNALYTSDPGLEQEFWVGQAPAAIGQVVQTLLGGIVTKSPKIATIIFGMGMTAGDAYDEVRAKGGTDEQAVNAGLIAGGLLGPTELIGMRGAMKAISGTARAATWKAALKMGAREGRTDLIENTVQEIGQEFGQGVITGDLRSWQELGIAGALGAVGGTVTVPLTVIRSRPIKGAQPLQPGPDIVDRPDEGPIALPAGERSIVPESPQAVAAQMDAMVNNRGNRVAVMIPTGQKGPNKIPKGYTRTRTPEGIVIHPTGYTSEDIEQLVDAGETWRLLGHQNPDAETATRVVVARAGRDAVGGIKAGDELMTSYAEPGQEQNMVDEMRQQFSPYKPYFEVGGAETAANVVAQRAEPVAAASAQTAAEATETAAKEEPGWRPGMPRRADGTRETSGEPGTKHPKTGRKFSSTQVDLPPEAAKLQKAAAAAIPTSELSEDGREDAAHITVKYGLHTEKPSEVAALLADEPPVRVKIGRMSIFPAKEGADYDVVKMDVDSPDLHRLNAKIAAGLEVTDTHPEYKPHVTLAYVKPGEGQKYVGKANALTGQEITLDSVLFSGRGGQEQQIKLRGTPASPERFAVLGNEQLEQHIARSRDRAAKRIAKLKEPMRKGTTAAARARRPRVIARSEARSARRIAEAEAELARRRAGTDKIPSFEKWLETESGGKAGGTRVETLSQDERAALLKRYDAQYHPKPSESQTRRKRRERVAATRTKTAQAAEAAAAAVPTQPTSVTKPTAATPASQEGEAAPEGQLFAKSIVDAIREPTADEAEALKEPVVPVAAMEGQNALSSYLGNKTTMARAGAFNIVPQSWKGKWKRIVDAFGGSGRHGWQFGQAFNLPVHYNELDADVYGFQELASTNEGQEKLRRVWGPMVDEIGALRRQYPNGGFEAHRKVSEWWKATQERLTGDTLTPEERGTRVLLENTLGTMGNTQSLMGENHKWKKNVESLAKVSSLLDKHRIHAGMWQTRSNKTAQDLLAEVKSGDLVLLDPPYASTHGYKEGGYLSTIKGAVEFIEKDVAAAAKRGISIIFTNSAHTQLAEALHAAGLHTRIEEVTTQGKAGAVRFEVVGWTPDVSPPRPTDPEVLRKLIGASSTQIDLTGQTDAELWNILIHAAKHETALASIEAEKAARPQRGSEEFARARAKSWRSRAVHDIVNIMLRKVMPTVGREPVTREWLITKRLSDTNKEQRGEITFGVDDKDARERLAKEFPPMTLEELQPEIDAMLADLQESAPADEEAEPVVNLGYRPMEGEMVEWTDADGKTKVGKILTAFPTGAYRVRVSGRADERRVRLPAETQFRQHVQVKVEVKRRAHPKYDPAVDSLWKAIRGLGGVFDDGSGEVGALKQSGRPGVVTKNGVTAEHMAVNLAEMGYGRGVWWDTEDTKAGMGHAYQTDVDANAFLSAAAEDAGSKRGVHFSSEYEPDMDAEERAYFEAQMTDDDRAQLAADEKFLGSEKVKRLLQEIEDGNATDEVYRQLREAGEQRGLDDDIVSRHIEYAEARAQESASANDREVSGEAVEAEEQAAGVEGRPLILQSAESGRGGIVAPSPTGNDKWRLTRFDSMGFSGHEEFNSQQEAEDTARKIWRLTEPMSEQEFVDLSSAEKFAAGNELTEFAQKRSDELTPADQQRINDLNDVISGKPLTDDDDFIVNGEPLFRRSSTEYKIKAILDKNAGKEPRFIDDTFFSQLYRTIESKMPNRATMAQMRQIIESPQNGVKADEVIWTGLDEWLKQHPKDQPVTKAEVLEFLRANAIDLQEVVKQPEGMSEEGDLPDYTRGQFNLAMGDKYVVEADENDDDPDTREIEADHNELPFSIKGSEDAGYFLGWETEELGYFGTFEQAMEAAYSHYDDLRQLQIEATNRAETQYETYVLPGPSTDYEEQVYTAPLETALATKNRKANNERVAKEMQAASDAMFALEKKHKVFAHIPGRYAYYEAGQGATFRHSDDFAVALNQMGNDAQRYTDLHNQNSRATQVSMKDTPTFESQHWPEENNIAHSRTTHRVDVEGKKGTLVEEVQSDLHQGAHDVNKDYRGKLAERYGVAPSDVESVASAGEKEILESKGYQLPRARMEQLHAAAAEEESRLKAELLPLLDPLIENFAGKSGSAQDVLNAIRDDKNWRKWDSDGVLRKDQQALADKWRLAFAHMYETKHQDDGPPAAPLSRTWHEFVMRRLIRKAVENGDDRIYWTTGKQQIDRWSEAIRQNVSKIRWSHGGVGKETTVRVEAFKKGEAGLAFNEVLFMHKTTPLRVSGETKNVRLEDVVGSKLAKQIREEPDGTAEGDDLAIGGEGMTHFYDKMLRSFMARFGRKFEATVGMVGLPRVTTAMIRLGQGWSVQTSIGSSAGDYMDTKHFATEAEAKEYAAEVETRDSVHYMDITPAMRESVMEGQPLFRRQASNWKRVANPDKIDYGEPDDDHLYHVLPADRVKGVLEGGLQPGSRPTVQGGGYQAYSKGKAFLTERSGVAYWRDVIERHLEHAHDNPPKVAVIRILRSKAGDLQIDEVGTNDARHNAYYATEPLFRRQQTPKEVIEAAGLVYKGEQVINRAGDISHLFDVGKDTLGIRGEVTPETLAAKLAEHEQKLKDHAAKYGPRKDPLFRRRLETLKEMGYTPIVRRQDTRGEPQTERSHLFFSPYELNRGTYQVSGKPVSYSILGVTEYGPNLSTRVIDKTAKIYEAENSYDFLKSKGLHNKPDPLIRRMSKGRYRTLDDVLEEAGGMAPHDIDPHTDLNYRIAQSLAERELRKEGYDGAHWSYEDDLSPEQYQIWNRDVIKRVGEVLTTKQQRRLFRLRADKGDLADTYPKAVTREGTRITIDEDAQEALERAGIMPPGADGITMNAATAEIYADRLKRIAEDANARDRALLEAVAAHLRAATKLKNTTSVIIATPDAMAHERFHQAANVGTLKGKHAHFDDLTALGAGGRPTRYAKARARLIAAGYPDHAPTLLEEMAAHIAEGAWGEIGLTRAEAVDFLAEWFESFVARNGDVTLGEFRRLANEGQNTLAAALNQQAETRENQRADTSVRGVQEGRASRARPNATARRRAAPGKAEPELDYEAQNQSLTDDDWGMWMAVDKETGEELAGFYDTEEQLHAAMKSMGYGPVRQTKTRAFLKWFGDSKVVDENGEPLVVYHGGSPDVEAFKPNQYGYVFFSPDPEYASQHASIYMEGTDVGGGTVYPTYVRIAKPLDITTLGAGRMMGGKFLTLIEKAGVNTDDLQVDLRHTNWNDQMPAWVWLRTKGLAQRIQEAGYDGIKGMESFEPGTPAVPMLIAFDPKQIKSATGNRGTFDPADPNILHKGPTADIADEPRFLGGRFFSQLYRTLVQKMPKQTSAAEIRRLITNPQSGVKTDEIKWSGLDDYLESSLAAEPAHAHTYGAGTRLSNAYTIGRDGLPAPKWAGDKTSAAYKAWEHGRKDRAGQGQFTRKEVLDFLKANNLQIDEKRLGGGRELTEAEYSHYLDMISNPTEGNVEDRIRLNNIRGGPPPKYATHTVPGKAENYREILFTLPDNRKPLAEARARLAKAKRDMVKALQIDGDVSEEVATDWVNHIHLGSPARRADARQVMGTPVADQHIRTISAASIDESNALNDKSGMYQSNHWSDTPNVLVHVRVDDRVTADGKRILFVNEVQSDWHQRGRRTRTQEIKRLIEDQRIRQDRPVTEEEKKVIARSVPEDYGYKRSAAEQKANQARRREIENERFTLLARQRIIDTGNDASLDKEHNANADRIRAIEAEMRDIDSYNADGDRVPPAPFQKNWHEFVMRRMLAEAVEGGYDHLAWATGDQSAELYDLSKQIDALKYEKRKSGGGYFISATKDGKEVLRKDVPVDDLEGFVGKEVAEKIIQGVGEDQYTVKPANTGGWGEWRVTHPTDKRPVRFFETKEEAQAHADQLNNDPLRPPIRGTLSGLDLKVGGEGMKGFYDKMIPDFMRRLVRKWNKDAKVEDIAVGQIKPESAEDAAKAVAWNMRQSSIAEVVWEALEEGQTLEDALELGQREADLQDDAGQAGARAEYRAVAIATRKAAIQATEAADATQQPVDDNTARRALQNVMNAAAEVDDYDLQEAAARVLGEMEGQGGDQRRTYDEAVEAEERHGDPEMASKIRGQVAMAAAEINSRQKVHAVRVTPEMRESLLADGQPLFRRRPKESDQQYDKRTQGALERLRALAASRGQQIKEHTPRRAEAATPMSAPATQTGDVRDRTPRTSPPQSEHKPGERSFPKSAERAGFIGGTDRDYTILTNEVSLEAADRHIARVGQSRAAAELAQNDEPGAEGIATGILLMQRFEKAGHIDRAVSVANDLARKLTRAGQEVQAASIIARLSPEGVLLAAQRQMRRGRDVPLETAKVLVQQANELSDAEKLIAELRRQRPDVFGPNGEILPQPKAVTQADSKAAPVTRKGARQRIGKLADRMATLEQQARARMEARSGKASANQPFMGLNPTIAADLGDLVIIGAAKLARASIDVSVWMAEMAKEASALTKRDLRKIYKESYAMYEAERKKFLTESRTRGAERIARGERGKIVGPPTPEALRAQGPLSPSEYRSIVNEVLDAQSAARKKRLALSRTFRDLNAGRFKKGLRHTRDVWNLSRSLITSLDFSAAGRQGKMGLFPHPKAWLQGFARQFRALSTTQYERIMSAIEADPAYKYAVRFKLHLAGFGGVREDAFDSDLVQYIPWIKHSEQAYNTMLNTLRMGWMKAQLERYRKAGLDPDDPDLKEMFIREVSLINAFTGRGGGRFTEKIAPVTNTLAFSTRFWASRLKVLTLPLDPRMYGDRVAGVVGLEGYSKTARIDAWKTVFGFYGVVASQIGLAALAGAHVGLDSDDWENYVFNPDNPDFLKVRFGKVHVDFTAGQQTHLRVAARLAMSFYKREFQKGKPRKGPGEILLDYGRSKLAPNPALIYDLFFSDKKDTDYGQVGTDYAGQPVFLLGDPGENKVGRLRTSALFQRVAPIVVQDAMEAYKESITVPQFTGATLASVLGEGVTTYSKGYTERSEKWPMAKELETLGVTINPPQRIKPGKYEKFKPETDQEYESRRKAEAQSVKRELERLEGMSYYKKLGKQDQERELRAAIAAGRAAARETTPAAQRQADARP